MTAQARQIPKRPRAARHRRKVKAWLTAKAKTESTADSESKTDSKADASSDSDSSNAEEKQAEKEVLLKKETYMGNDLSERCTYSYEYDKSTGHYIRTEQKESSSIQKPGTMETSYISKNEYDKDMTLIATYNEAGQLTLKNELNENGKVSKSTQYTKTGTVQGYHLYEYDNDGNCTKDTYYNSKGKIQETYSYEYSNGKKTKEKYESNGVVNENTITYNEKGDIVRVEYNKDRYVDYTYEYTNEGGYKKTIKSKLNSNVSTIEETYNSNGDIVIRYTPHIPETMKYYYGKLPK